MYEFDNIIDAKNWLAQGKLLSYPTESVWGIGCDAMNKYAVQRILAIKNRSIDKGMIVVTDSSERITPLLTTLTQQQKDLMLLSWQEDDSSTKQQATTWLLPITDDKIIPSWITGQHKSIAVRVIAHPLIKQLCASMVSLRNPFGFIISTSCNPATYTPATTLAEAHNYFQSHGEVGYLLGETLEYEMPSQIRDALSGDVLR